MCKRFQQLIRPIERALKQPTPIPPGSRPPLTSSWHGSPSSAAIARCMATSCSTALARTIPLTEHRPTSRPPAYQAAMQIRAHKTADGKNQRWRGKNEASTVLPQLPDGCRRPCPVIGRPNVPVACRAQAGRCRTGTGRPCVLRCQRSGVLLEVQRGPRPRTW